MQPPTFPGYERVAYRSTQGSGVFAKKRWTEIELWYREGVRQPFIVRIIARSSVPSERTIRTTHRARNLHLALERLDQSQPARAVAEQASYWAQDNKVPMHG